MRRVLYATKEQEVILLNHSIFKWSTQGKVTLFSEAGLSLLLWDESRAWLSLDCPGNAEGARTPDCHCFPCEVSVAASLAGLKPMVEQLATWGVMRKPEQHQGKDMRWSSCWTKKGESWLLLLWSLGQAERHCCVTQPCVPNEPRLHEAPWLQVVSGQSTCPLDTKEINSAVSCL